MQKREITDPWAEADRLARELDATRAYCRKLQEGLDEAYRAFTPSAAQFTTEGYRDVVQAMSVAQVTLQSPVYRLAVGDIEVASVRDPNQFVRTLAARMAGALTTNLAKQCEAELRRITGIK